MRSTLGAIDTGHTHDASSRILTKQRLPFNKSAIDVTAKRKPLMLRQLLKHSEPMVFRFSGNRKVPLNAQHSLNALLPISSRVEGISNNVVIFRQPENASSPMTRRRGACPEANVTEVISPLLVKAWAPMVSIVGGKTTS